MKNLTFLCDFFQNSGFPQFKTVKGHRTKADIVFGAVSKLRS